ncbi:MAG: PTS sugar transporter subunit IIA [Chloroflexi bacterium]|jgi:PTS system fructose-specific IIA component|nr:PTS sugar transporter subunit IIA [Chloroflexota bacterium]
MNSDRVNFNEVINPTTIDLNMEVQTKEEAFDKLAEILIREKRISEKEEFIEDILKREQLESTNMGIGVAIPHGKSSAVIKNTIAIARLIKPVSWDATQDGNPVRVIFLLAVCDDANKNKVHLELISKVAALLLQEKFLTTLFNTESKTELIDQIFNLIGDM